MRRGEGVGCQKGPRGHEGSDSKLESVEGHVTGQCESRDGKDELRGTGSENRKLKTGSGDRK